MVEDTATPVTPVFKASITPSPTAKNTKVPKPTATPTPVDPMNASISGKVWNDANNNGSINVGEPGLANATVKLRAGSCGSAVIASTTTGSSGNYSFTGLAAGTYCVTATGSGSKTANTTPDSVTVVLSVGQSKSVNFGFQTVID